ncbi:MAG: SDR family oxidoreductase [Lactobacillaceae bacterium]|nr:SDR family oxidoreductase [Lactobacillaceae bacterium]
MRKILITGASNGIGLAIAETLISNGDFVYNVDIVPPEKTCSNYRYIESDLSKLDSFEVPSDIDILINNVGVSDKSTRLVDLTWDQIFNLVNVNFVGQMFLSRQVIQTWLELNKKGLILTVSSIASYLAGVGEGSVYTSLKHAQNGLIKGLAAEYGPFGIRSIGLAPGAVDTAMNSYMSSTEMEAVSDVIPLRRWSTPQEIAMAAKWLVSEENTFMNGTTLILDGGDTIFK